jgi:hypothetical protein
MLMHLVTGPAAAACGIDGSPPETADGALRRKAEGAAMEARFQRRKTGSSTTYNYAVEPFAMAFEAGLTTVTAHLSGDFRGSRSTCATVLRSWPTKPAGFPDDLFVAADLTTPAGSCLGRGAPERAGEVDMIMHMLGGPSGLRVALLPLGTPIGPGNWT